MAKHLPQEPQRRLESISIAGYKSIKDRQTIEIRPLTVLAGANSGGKSSLMQPLLLLKQTLEAPYDPGPLLLNGQNVRFTASEQLLPRKGKATVAKTLEIGIGVDGMHIGFSLSPIANHGMSVNSITFSADKKSVSIAANSDAKAILKELGAAKLIGNHSLFENERFEITRERFFLTIEARVESPKFRYVAFHPGSMVEPLLSGLIHVPGLRGNPQRYYPTTGVGKTFPGTFENYVASVVQHWQSEKDDRLTTLSRQLENLGLTWKVQATRIDDTQVELRVGRLSHPKQGGAHDLVSIADVGFGVSQTLPVLVALLAADPGQVVYLEQPEIHLHPKAQRALGGVLAEAATRGVIVVVETHSALLLRAIQTLVAKDEISTDLVKLHWVTRDETSGFTTVASCDLDDTGAFGDWPVDFDEQVLAAEDDYLTAAETKLATGRK